MKRFQVMTDAVVTVKEARDEVEVKLFKQNHPESRHLNDKEETDVRWFGSRAFTARVQADSSSRRNKHGGEQTGRLEGRLKTCI